MHNIDIHADDYGYSLNTSKDILDCIKSGNLDSFSIICNMPRFEESMQLLYDAIPSLKFLPTMSIHINLPEGIFDNDFFPKTWGQLFLTINNDKNRTIIKEEIIKQIDKTQEVINKCLEIAKKNSIPCKQKSIRIDSHIHTHLIPVVWDALVLAIEEKKYDVEYIRNPKEPIIPFIKHPNGYGLVNLLKNRILMFYSRKVDDYCDLHDIEKVYMWGLMMSGHMDFDRINSVYVDMANYASSHNRKLVLLFHPGQATRDEHSSAVNEEYFVNANLSNNRRIEKEAVMRISEVKHG